MSEIALRDGSTTKDVRLDRLVSFDDRSRQFRAVAGLETYPLRSYSWRTNGWLDQGFQGSCVGHAWAHELIARPAEIPTSSQTAVAIYKRAQQLDPWEGEAYEGTSVLAGAKATMELTTVKGKPVMESYRWIFGLEDGVRTVGYKGPIVLGIAWKRNMFDVDAEGFIHATGDTMGGHAILWHSVKCIFTGEVKNFANLDLDKSYAVLHNSWGRTSWGVEGRAKITLRNLAALLAENGEGCLAVKRNY